MNSVINDKSSSSWNVSFEKILSSVRYHQGFISKIKGSILYGISLFVQKAIQDLITVNDFFVFRRQELSS